MDGAGPSEDVRQTPPGSTSYPPISSPSPSTLPFLLKASLSVKSSSGNLILQDYRRTQGHEQALGRLAAVIRQSVQNKASSPDFHQPQSPNFQPPPSRSLQPITSVSETPVQSLPLSQHSQDRTGPRTKQTAPIQHHPASVAISDTASYGPPLLRPGPTSGLAPKASSPAIPAPALNASRLQHQHPATPEVVTPPFTPLALYVLHDRGASSQTLNPHWSLQFSRIRTPGLEWLSYSNPPSTERELSKMSSFTNLFKRPRSKSEKQLGQSPPPARASTISGSPSTCSSVPGSPVFVPELPAHWGPFYQAGERNPHSPLRRSPGVFRSMAPTGPPQIDEADIGRKFPTLSHGPGIERRVFIDPTFQRPNPFSKPPYHAGTSNAGNTAGGHRRSVSFDDVTRYRLGRSADTHSLPRTKPREHFTPTFDDSDDAQENLTVSDENESQSPKLYFPEQLSDDDREVYGDSMVDSIVQKYAGAGNSDMNIDSQADDASRLSRNIEIDSRLSQWVLSPRNDTLGSPTDIGSTPPKPTGYQSTLSHVPSEPPTASLPHLPFFNFSHGPYQRNDVSATTGYSSPSYGNTRNLLGLTLSDEDRKTSMDEASVVSSTVELMLKRLLSNRSQTSEPSPCIARTQSSTRFARVSLVRPDGSTHSRQLSRQETSVFEQEVFVRLRDSGNLGEAEERYIHQGRLSLEYLETESHSVVDPGPGSSQSSSSLSAARPRIMRSGTPPLLFGSRAIGKEEQSIAGLPFNGANSRGSLDMAARALGIRETRRLGRTIAGEEDEQDWETVADSRGRAHRDLEDIEATAGTGSSLADYSDSSKLSAAQSVPRGQVLVQPSHPRYQHSWSMLQDRQNGNLVLTPESSGTSVFPNRTAVAPLFVNRDTSPTYHHPTPLSQRHANPFSTPPPPIRSSSEAAYSEHQSPPPLPLKSPARQFVSSRTKENVSRRTLTHVDDGEWLSTVDGETSVNDREEFLGRAGSSSALAVLDPKDNITGTHQGTGVREAGSSLADASSPLNQFDNADSGAAKVQHRRTIDVSLDSIANAPGNFYERIRNHRIFKTDSDEESSEHAFESTPPEALSPEIRQHRQHLIESSLLPRLPTPPFTEPKRLSVPTYLLKSTGSANMVKSGPNTTATSLAQEDGSQVRMRSPHRGDQEDDMSTNIPTPFSLNTLQNLTEIPLRQKKTRARHAKLRAKAKVSDGESSPEAKAPEVVFEQPRVIADGGTSTSTLPAERRRFQNQPEPRINNAANVEPRATQPGPMIDLYDDFIRATRTPPSHPREPQRPVPANAVPRAAQAGPNIPNIGLYDEFIRATRPPSNPQGRSQLPIPTYRPTARAGSTHLHRLPRPTGDVIEKREKELSRVVLALCLLLFPVLIIYGHGFMDGVMSHISKDQIVGFRKQEKVVALWLGYGLFAGLVIALVVAALLGF